MKWICFVLCGLFGAGNTNPAYILDVVSDIPNPINVQFFNKCIEDLGCFYTGKPFYDVIARPISLLPQKPDTKFQLYTPSNPDDQYDLKITKQSLNSSTFDPSLPTKFIIHGFRSDVKDRTDIRHKIRAALLKEGRFNVIIVDWTANNGLPYEQAASNTRTTGAEVAKLIHFLIKKKKISAESVHLIGHSLGGQIAGYIGERVPNIGRITGLDPAGPYFQDMKPEVHLDTTDALFVDVIHTDGGESMLNGLGTSLPVGHIDFYVNGGRRQPGCTYASESESAVGAAVNFTAKWLSNACDHNRANEYFLESIDNSKCKFLAVRCTSYRDFEKGLCPPENSTVAEMGYHAKPMPKQDVPAKFFLRTNPSSPFCIQDSIVL